MPEPAGGEERPIFVLGWQRSGTTLLQSLLGSHPRIAAPPEVHFWLRIHMLRSYWGDLEDDRNLRRVVAATVRAPADLLADAGFDEQRLFERVAAGPRTYASVLDTLMSDFAERHGKSRWSEKSPTQNAGDILSLFPDAQLVHIIRDPRDVVGSCLKMPWNDQNAWLLAREWRSFNLNAIATGSRAGPDRYMMIRYEDLASDPEPVLRQVFAFLNEDFESAVLSDVQARKLSIAHTDAPWSRRALEPVGGPSRSRRSLSRMQIARVAAVVADVLAPLGYPAASRKAAAIGRVVNVALSAQALPSVLWGLRVRFARRDPDRLASLVQGWVGSRVELIEQAQREATNGSG